MKLVHTADWHLGKSIYGRSLLPDQEYFIDRVFLPLLRREHPDLVLLCGDIFDRPIAPVEAIRLFDHFLTEIHALGIMLAVISGNHDGADRMAVGAGLLQQSGVYIVSEPSSVFTPLCFSLDGEMLHLYQLPYCEPAQLRQLLLENSLRGFQDSYSALFAKIRQTLDPEAVNVLMAHCFVAGSTVSASESPIYVGGSGEVSAQTFAGFDYVALGHLHAPQRAGENGWYSGSPLKYSFDESSHKKSVTILELHKGRKMLRKEAFSPLRDLRVLTGTFEELLRQGREAPSGDYCYAELSDNAPVYLPMDRLREYWPNLLGLSSHWLTQTGAGENNALRDQFRRRRPDDTSVFETFLEQICGQEAEPGDRELFLRAMKEIEGGDGE